MNAVTYATPGALTLGFLEQISEEPQRVKVLVGLPGHLWSEYAGRRQVMREPGAIPRSILLNFKRALLDELGWSVDHRQGEPSARETINRCIQRIEAREITFHIATDASLHTCVIAREDRSIVSGAPLTGHDLDAEINLELKGVAHGDVRGWFERRMKSSADVSSDVLGLLLASWAGDSLHPEDFYYKVLGEYFSSTMDALDHEVDRNPMIEVLTDFQHEAYVQAKGIIRRYGGVFLSDVVGLGKTFIALALIRYLQDRYGQYAVVVAPPNICPTWDALAAEYRIELQTVSSGKLSDLDRMSGREVLVIDESHNFRNKSTLKYDRISGWLRPNGGASSKRVLLLSATPQNNSADDVRNQIAFFPDNHTRLPYTGEGLGDFFKKVKQGEAELSRLLQHIIVRRTRTYVQRYYPDSTLRKRDNDGVIHEVPLRFPQRIAGEEQSLRYLIEETYGVENFQSMLTMMRELRHPLFALDKYLREDALDDHRIEGIRRSKGNISGLYRVLLLKRFESSVQSFKLTLERLHQRLSAALDDLRQGRVALRIEPSDVAEKEDEVDSSRRVVDAGLFDVIELEKDLLHDGNAVGTALQRIVEVARQPDTKLERLRRFLKERNPVDHKTIIFTQFSDTADYLYNHLSAEVGRCEVVSARRGNALSCVRRFSPKSNRVNDVEDEIDLLISTDTLSEGANLQDADTLINYDLHWNPVRLIQRAGRIDRIGSEHAEIQVASFLPARAIEADLRLEEILRKRIDEFLAVFGEDSRVLPSGEVLDHGQMLSAYTGKALEIAEDDTTLEGLSRHVDRLFRLRRTDRERYDRIMSMRAGQRSYSNADARGVVACRMGWLWSFYVEYGADLRALEDGEALDLLQAHGVAGPDLATLQPARISGLDRSCREAMDRFMPLADAFREQRLHPRLTPGERFVFDQLQIHAESCSERQKPMVVEILAWVASGSARTWVDRSASLWKAEGLSSEAIYLELKAIYTGQVLSSSEELGDPELIGGVIGVDPSRSE